MKEQKKAQAQKPVKVAKQKPQMARVNFSVMYSGKDVGL